MQASVSTSSCSQTESRSQHELPDVSEPYQSPKLQLARALLQAGELTRTSDPARAARAVARARSRALDRRVPPPANRARVARREARPGRGVPSTEFAILDRQLRGELGEEWYPTGSWRCTWAASTTHSGSSNAGVEYSLSIGSTVWLAHHCGRSDICNLAAGRLPEARDLLAPLPQYPRDGPRRVVSPSGAPGRDRGARRARRARRGSRSADRGARGSTARASIGRGHSRPQHGRRHCWPGPRRVDAALDAAERALAEHERLDWPLEQARTRARDAEPSCGGSGADATPPRCSRKRGRARRAAQSALARARRGGGTRRLGGRRATSELTPTEARVAELAGRGLQQHRDRGTALCHPEDRRSNALPRLPEARCALAHRARRDGSPPPSSASQTVGDSPAARPELRSYARKRPFVSETKEGA